MKTRLIKLTAFMLTIILTIGMCTVFAGAYNTADFSDVPSTHWAYGNIMGMADKGIIKGVGAGKFEPESGLKVGEFLALVGRAMYSGDCNEAGTSAWWETYYNTAVSKGIVTTTELTAADMERAITRNEMARILVRTDEKVNGNNVIAADTKAITDFDSIPDEFKVYASQAYAKGLLTGDEGGNFNGDNNLKRSEAATVIKRLMDAADKPTEVTTGATGATITGEMITVKFAGYAECFDWYAESNTTAYFYPEGVNMVMSTADGRVLGTTTTYEVVQDSRGRFTYTMEVTMDKADFAYDKDIYYMTCTYIAPDGTRYSNISAHTGMGRAFRLPSSSIYLISKYDFTGSNITFHLKNSPSSYLDF